MSQPSVFRHYAARRQLILVDVDDVKLWTSQTGIAGIGTRSLNGCTCIVILGKGIILAHVSPLPGSAEQWEGTSEAARDNASHAHHLTFLHRIEGLLAQNAGQFPPSTTAWGIFACESQGADGPRGQMQRIVRQVQEGLAAMGYGMNPAFYQAINHRDVVSPKGELAVISTNGILETYLERARLWTSTPASSSSTQYQAGRAPPEDEDERDEDAEKDDADSEDDNEDDDSYNRGHGGRTGYGRQGDERISVQQPTRTEMIRLRIQQAKNRRDQMLSQGQQLNAVINTLKFALQQAIDITEEQAITILRQR